MASEPSNPPSLPPFRFLEELSYGEMITAALVKLKKEQPSEKDIRCCLESTFGVKLDRDYLTKELGMLKSNGIIKKEDNEIARLDGFKAKSSRRKIARLDGLKVKSSRRKRCSASRVSFLAKLERLKAESPLIKELLEREEAYRDAFGGEIGLLKTFARQNPNPNPKPKPKFDSQGFQIYTPQGVSERERLLVSDASSPFDRNQPCWKPCWINYTAYYLYEFACGYALFEVHGVNELYLSNLYNPNLLNFKSNEEYLKRSDQIFTLKAFHPFPSTVDALVQMNIGSKSRLGQHLKNFLADNLPNYASYYVTTCDTYMLDDIATTMRMSYVNGQHSDDLTRGLRMNIDKYIDGLKPKDVEKAQMNLARLYNRQVCTTYVESSIKVSSSSLQRVVVVPYRLEGVFIAKGKEDFICTRNLVPGESLYSEELIFVQNEDGTEVEYKVWNPLRSKLATAILCGVTNIWVKPGSRILYLGDDVCPITVSHLSDLVGLDGLVYVVGLSDVAVNMAEKRSNVITVYQKPSNYRNYHMFVGMVDVIYAENVHPDQVNNIISNARIYLRAGGHYMVCTRVNNIYLTSRGKDPFANHARWMEFTPIEVVILNPIDRAYAIAVGGFRMLEE